MTLIEEVQARRTLPTPAQARNIREAAGVSQHRLARELGVARATVARWETGSRIPRGNNLIAYVAMLTELRGQHGR